MIIYTTTPVIMSTKISLIQSDQQYTTSLITVNKNNHKFDAHQIQCTSGIYHFLHIPYVPKYRIQFLIPQSTFETPTSNNP